MAEWSNAAVLKTVGRSRGPGVRIPLSPHNHYEAPLGLFLLEEAEAKLALNLL